MRVLNKIKQAYLLQNFSEPLLREGTDLLRLSNLLAHRIFSMEHVAKISSHIRHLKK